MRRGVTAGMLAALLLAGCSDDDEPVYPPDPDASVAPPAYDPELEPAAAVLALVPEAATVLTVTDFDQLRLQLGTPTLTSKDPAPRRAEFWRRVDAETAALADGLLRPFDDQLAEDYGFTQDDVLWEAHFDGGGVDGWLLRFRDDLDMQAVRRAVDDGIGPLAGVQVAAEQRVVGVDVARDPDESWAADVALTELVGTPAAATYVERDCIPFDDAFGPGVRDQLATGTDADMAELTELGPFSVAFGGDLATARLGPERPDAFARARLADTMPESDPSFGDGFERPVADPSTGRIGYSLGDPRAAAELTLARHLPFAVCADS